MPKLTGPPDDSTQLCPLVGFKLGPVDKLHCGLLETAVHQEGRVFSCCVSKKTTFQGWL